MRTKTFDCIRMKDKIQEEIYADIKDLTPEKQIIYFQESVQKSVALRDKLARIQQVKKV